MVPQPTAERQMVSFSIQTAEGEILPHHAVRQDERCAPLLGTQAFSLSSFVASSPAQVARNSYPDLIQAFATLQATRNPDNPMRKLTVAAAQLGPIQKA